MEIVKEILKNDSPKRAEFNERRKTKKKNNEQTTGMKDKRKK